MRCAASVLIALAILPSPLAAQGRGESGAFVVRLGRDTTAVERFTRTATLLEGEIVVRAPRTGLRRYRVDFGPTGAMTRAEVTVLRADNPAAPPTQRVVATFTRDSVVVETRRDTAVMRRLAVPAGASPVIAGPAASWVAFELLVARLRRERADSLAVPVYVIGAAAAGSWRVGRLGRDSVWLYDGNDTFHARVDRNGRIHGAIPLSGTQQFTVERVASADIAALAQAFAARDQLGQPLGQLSTRDTVRATVAGASLWVDYGRPAKRGRVIFGSTIVPWNQVWRTGANAATQLRTDRALEIQGVAIPAGTYTLWTIPSPGGWKLLFNRETGQWGTSHDPARDIAQLDLRVTTLPSVVERFTIGIAPEGAGGIMHLDWDTTRASLTFTVR